MTSRARWIAGAEALAATIAVVGDNLCHLLPNSVFVLVAMALISFRLREGRWTVMGLDSPKSWMRTIAMAVAAAIVQQAVGQWVVDPLTQPVLHYSAAANPLQGSKGFLAVAQWLGIIWTYAAFGEEIGYRAYVLNRVAEFGGGTRAALVLGLIWSSILFGTAHSYQGPAGIVSGAASGLIFGAAYLLARRNLWVPVLAHGFSDTLALVLSILAG
ncbi:MAG TPA: CPBP family intramembrane glutamic endopeptidase [Rhizomicrobium sp.]|nr:CPBP family intramembrane glutamic endopeptidase [Rhizomicrobium sp.]